MNSLSICVGTNPISLLFAENCNAAISPLDDHQTTPQTPNYTVRTIGLSRFDRIWILCSAVNILDHGHILCANLVSLRPISRELSSSQFLKVLDENNFTCICIKVQWVYSTSLHCVYIMYTLKTPYMRQIIVFFYTHETLV